MNKIPVIIQDTITPNIEAYKINAILNKFGSFQKAFTDPHYTDFIKQLDNIKSPLKIK